MVSRYYGRKVLSYTKPKGREIFKNMNKRKYEKIIRVCTVHCTGNRGDDLILMTRVLR